MSKCYWMTRGADRALVESGSQAERELAELGFVADRDEPEAKSAEPEESEPKGRRGRKVN